VSGDRPVADGEVTRGLFRLGRWFRIRERLSRWEYVVLALVPILLTLILWQVLTSGTPEERTISINILPSPREVAAAFPALWMGSGTETPFIYQVSTSFQRILISFAIGCASALPIGFAMGAFERARAVFYPIALVGGYLPIPALVPLTMSFFGTGEGQKIAFLSIAFFVYLLPQVVLAVDKVDQVFLQTAYTLGANTWQALTRVLISISWEDVYRAMRGAFGVGWSYILLVEMLIIKGGLGAVVFNAQRRSHPEHMYLCLLAIVLIAFGTDKLWEWGGRMLFPYRRVQ
jgi:NitT/TauT family transport system permease protein